MQPESTHTSPCDAPDCPSCEPLQARIVRLEKINRALSNRVERGLDWQGDSFVLFQAAIAMETKVHERTSALNRALEDLAASNRELQLAKIAAEQASEEMRKALEQEKELSELKTRFIAMASHEFRTPLTTIHSSAELLNRFYTLWPADKIQKHLDRIESNVAHMTGLLEDVLILGRIDSGHMECHQQELDARAYLLDLMEELTMGGLLNAHSVDLTLPENGVMMTSDPSLIRMAVTNLVSNAVKYSDPGKRIVITMRSEVDTLILSVTDEGIGIPPEDVPYLFEPFHRASNVDTRPGTGLGLTVLQRAVSMHQGSITVESTLGKGTAFTIMLPRHCQLEPTSDS
ncbi:MAG: HAMP domain-containing sensor histidine kinase [Rhodothermales bacterium]|nr:HAMP domain-containing sensor histidine kinase [Rhodothermales bacterium]